MTITPMGQRDSRWASKLLGFNTLSKYTIGNYGCLITALSMYLTAIGKPETPDTFNEKVKALKDANGKPNGFVNGGDLVWSAPERIWGVKCVYQSPYYEGLVTSQGTAKMKALIDEGRPLVCHGDFDPNDPDDDQHWVLITDYSGDNFFCNDPWTGQHVNVDVYGGSVQRAVIEWRAYEPKVSVEGSVMVQVESKVFENLVRKSTLYDWIIQTLGITDSETVVKDTINQTIGYEDTIAKLEAEKRNVSQQAKDLQTQLETTKKELQETESHNAVLTKEVQKNQEMIDILTIKVDSLSVKLHELETESQKPVQKPWYVKLWDFFVRR